MPTRWSHTLIPTVRQLPADAEVPSHQLMLRAGLIQRLGSGLYNYLPLGWRSLQKVIKLIREEMDRTGALEVFLPALQPINLWERSGRRADYGEVLFVLEDRHGREQALGPTHEEVITDMIGSCVSSYRNLPITLYQIQTKFRDEYRPRFGVLRSREFLMKDAYSFDLDSLGLDRSYQTMYDGYCRIFDRCGLPYEIVEAESGAIGGSANHEFMVPSPTGEDVILKSDKGNYAANIEKCEIGMRPHTFDGGCTGELEKVNTPDCATIDDLCSFFTRKLKSKLKTENILKTLVHQLGSGPGWVLTVVRGDHEVNEAKVRALFESEIQLANESLARQAGFAIGYVGPHVCQVNCDVILVVDSDAAQNGFWVTGANENDRHVKHFNWKRDVVNHIPEDKRSALLRVADIRDATDGDPSPRNDGGILNLVHAIEIGHVFKIGTKYSQSLGVEVLDGNNNRIPITMGCYGIGVNRILASAIERQGGHDENGIIWPPALAPYAVIITPIHYEGQMKTVANRLAVDIEATGRDVLIDDRVERPGVKFKDADLIGIPLRITVGAKALQNGNVELKPRTADKPQLVAVEQAAAKAVELLDAF